MREEPGAEGVERMTSHPLFDRFPGNTLVLARVLCNGAIGARNIRLAHEP